MKIFVSSQSVDSENVQRFIPQLIATGFTVDHSPRNPSDGDDPRWTDWYDKGLPAAIAAADCFLIVIDAGWDSASWMAEEARIAELSKMPMYFWNPGAIQVRARGMLPYLKIQLPRDLDDAIRFLKTQDELDRTRSLEL